MPARALVFELDGTLLNTAELETDAFQHAFLTQGFRVNADRIAPEVGQPLEHIVQAILGPLAWHTYGKRIGDIYETEFVRHCRVARLRLLPGAGELLDTLKKQGLQLALTTHASPAQLDAMEEAAATDLWSYFDVVVTAHNEDPNDQSLTNHEIAARKLGLHPAQCIAVGHTRFAIGAARRSGMTAIAFDSQRRPSSSAGARCRFAGAGEMLAGLPSTLHACSPLSFDLTPERMADLLSPAFDAAQQNLADGGAPIGAALFDSAGHLIAAGANQSHRTDNPLHHAEIVTLERATGRFDPAAKNTVLVSTLEPCVLCTGAAMEVGIDTVIFGLTAPADAGTHRVAPPSSPESTSPRTVGGFRADESLTLFNDYLDRKPPDQQAAFARQLLALHGQH